MRKNNWLCASEAFVIGILLLTASPAAASPSTLERVQSRGALRCGVGESRPGFAMPVSATRWAGFDIDFCRALSAAIFDDPERVEVVALTAETKYDALRSGQIDLLARAPIVLINTDARRDIRFPVATFFSGLTFLVPKRAGIMAAAGLRTPTICLVENIQAETKLAAFFARTGKKHLIWTFTAYEDASDAYEEGRCDALSDTVSALAEEKALLKRPDDHVILADTISIEPSGPAVRAGDERWAALIRWTHFAMLEAEERGLSRADRRAGQPPAALSLEEPAGAEDGHGPELGLGSGWMLRVIRHVGNYGESFERNLGQGSPVKINRGRNALWNRGGLLYAPPLR